MSVCNFSGCVRVERECHRLAINLDGGCVCTQLQKQTSTTHQFTTVLRLTHGVHRSIASCLTVPVMGLQGQSTHYTHCSAMRQHTHETQVEVLHSKHTAVGAQCNMNNFPYLKYVPHKICVSVCLQCKLRHAPLIYNKYHVNKVCFAHMQHLIHPFCIHQLSETHLPQVLAFHSGVVHSQHVLRPHCPRAGPLHLRCPCPPPHCLAVGLLHTKPLVVGTAHVELGACLQRGVLGTATLCDRQHVAETLHLQHNTSSTEPHLHLQSNQDAAPTTAVI